MKCGKCAAEVPGQAQFCMKCGAPVTVGRPGGGTHVIVPRQPKSHAKTAAMIIAACVALATGAFIVGKNFTNKNSASPNAGTRLTDANGRALNGSGLVDTGGRIGPAAGLTDKTNRADPGPPNPTDVIDYLKHIREMERQRVELRGAQVGQAKGLTAMLPAANIATMLNSEGDWQKENKEKYDSLTQKFNKWPDEWQALSTRFLAYPKAVPNSCVQLRDYYQDALGKTNGEMVRVGSMLAKALGGNPSDALEELGKLEGKSSRPGGIDEAYRNADEELARVCDKFRLHKDFDIKPDGGSASPF